ncbi:MAG: DNA-formamidopyrimidine glycosylase family protein [Acidimicrobiales bacterium]
MPELPELECYRQLAERALLRRIVGVDAHDAWMLKRGADAAAVTAALAGRRFTAARRRGKLLVLDVDGGGPSLGLRFGMTGRLLVDGLDAVGALQHAPSSVERRWDRFSVRFADGGDLRLQDPRRLGGVELEPDEGRLGPDALAISEGQLAAALTGSAVAVKARIMDQGRVAGAGNLIADEVLWRSGLSPLRPAGSLDAADVAVLHRTLRSTLRLLIRRGGAHTGDLIPERHPGGRCPRDGAPLVRATVGGRTTWWCPAHQR